MARQYSVLCPGCGAVLKGDRELFSAGGRCPKCKTVIKGTESAPPKVETSAPGPCVINGHPVAPNAILKIRMDDDVAVVNFSQARLLDHSNVEKVGEELDALLDTYNLKRIVLDFANVEYLSSRVLGKLTLMHRRADKAGARFVLCCIKSDVLEVFRIMKLHKLFTITLGEPEAIAVAREK